MIRTIVKRVALWHDRRRLRRRGGERGIDVLRRSARLTDARVTRVRLPGWRGRLWRWLYAGYYAHLARERDTRMAALPMGEYVRETLREQAFNRKILPPTPIALDADLSVRL